MYGIPGLTSPKVQSFINSMCSQADTYLEIGCYLGATACAALNNNKLDAYFVDTWDEDIRPYRDDIQLPKNDKELFKENIRQFKGENNVNIFHCDMFDVDLSKIKPIDIFFYDGPHGEDTINKVFQYYYPVLSDTCLVIVDDANFSGVVSGTNSALEKLNVNIIHSRLLLNYIEDELEWWNGLYILLVNKKIGN